MYCSILIGAGRQNPFDVKLGILLLPEQYREKLPAAVPHAFVRARETLFDSPAELRQCVKRHHGIDMVLNVVFHVHKKKSKKKVHFYRSCVHTVVPDILVKARMLEQYKRPLKKSSIESWQTEKQDWKPAFESN